MSTQFRPLEIPPGVVAKPTKQMSSSNWSQVNLMRWVEGQMGPVGGQARLSDTSSGAEAYVFASRCRAIHSWYDLSGVYHIAYLCEANLYVDTGGVLIEITPALGPGNPINYSGGEYGVGTYSGDSAYGLVPPTPVGLGGYGDGLYSADDYGTPRSINSIEQLDEVPDAWSLHNFGAVLYAMTSPDGRLLQWDPAVGGPAIVTPNAPHGRLFVVTQERFLMIFGMTQDGTSGGGSARRFGWCDQENPESWNFSDVTSQAGYLDVEPASPIIAALATRVGVLFWTGTTTYISTFLGIPYVYDYVELAKNCTPWSPQSSVATSSLAVWMSQQGLFSFDGTSVAPIACPVRPWVDDDIDLQNVREQACMIHVATFNEVWWFYPQSPATNASGQGWNTRVIIYSYKEGWWSEGQMSRSAGITSSYTAPTIMADGLVAFEHEMPSPGVYCNAALPWAETFDLNLASGSKLVTIKQMIPDVGGDVTNLLYSLFYKNARSVMPDVNGNPILVVEQQTAPVPVWANGFVDFRTTGRDIRLRIALRGPQVSPVTVGAHLIDSVIRGDR